MHTKFKFGKVINRRRAPLFQRAAKCVMCIDDLAAFPGTEISARLIQHINRSLSQAVLNINEKYYKAFLYVYSLHLFQMTKLAKLERINVS
jgi:hypothetical protein